MNEESEQFRFEELDDSQKDKLYQAFRDSYQKSTGMSWDRNTFFYKAKNWIFYGTKPGFDNHPGFVAAFPQRSGLLKMSGAAGNPLGIARGIQLLLQQNSDKGVWGMVSKELVAPAVKMGFLAPPPELLKKVINEIPKLKELFNISSDLDQSGGLKVNITNIGEVNKYFIANPKYFRFIMMDPSNTLSSQTKEEIQSWLDQTTGKKNIFSRTLQKLGDYKDAAKMLWNKKN